MSKTKKPTEALKEDQRIPSKIYAIKQYTTSIEKLYSTELITTDEYKTLHQIRENALKTYITIKF